MKVVWILQLSNSVIARATVRLSQRTYSLEMSLQTWNRTRLKPIDRHMDHGSYHSDDAGICMAYSIPPPLRGQLLSAHVLTDDAEMTDDIETINGELNSS